MKKLENYLESKGFSKTARIVNLQELSEVEAIVMPALNILTDKFNEYGLKCEIDKQDKNSIVFKASTSINSYCFYVLSLSNDYLIATISKSDIYGEPESPKKTELKTIINEITENDITNDFIAAIISFDIINNIQK